MSLARRSLCTDVLRSAFVIAALASISSLGAQQPGADGPSKALEGKWTLELYLGRPSARTEPMAGQINGEVAFSNTAWWNPSDRFGRHNLNLQSFFGRSFLRPNVSPFGPGDTSMVTEVSGSVRGDSVGIDFMPRIDHGGLSLWGRFWGDSAKGTWHRRGADGDGRFVLRRLTKEAVTVASIPDGRRAAVAIAAAPEKPLTKAELRAKTRADAAAKLKADEDARAVARAQAQEKAKADALARAQARDSAQARALVVAQARKDSIAQAKAALAVRRDSIAQAKVTLAQARKDSAARAKLAVTARRDSIAQAKVALAAQAKKDSIAQTPAAIAARKDSAERARVALVAALKDSIAQVRASLAARTGANRASAPPAAAAPTAGARPTTVAANIAAATPPPSTSRTAASGGGGPPNASPSSAPNAGGSAAPNVASRPPAATTPAVTPPVVTQPAAVAPVTGAAAAPATPTATATSAATPANALRVRTYDVASNTYFVTKYSLHLPDGHWLYGRLRTGSGSEGWGPPVVRPPGKYEIEITDFMCGDKVWFLKNKILKPVVIEPGKPTDVTVDINVKTEPARPSLENKEGATCSAAPGTPR